MRFKKFSTSFIIILMISVGLLFSGCYTQFSRPDVDTEYYPQDDEQYESEYYSEEDYDDDVDVNYYDIYLYEAPPPVYFGPHVWTYWSPYYRWYGYDRFYNPWLNDYMYWGVAMYAPFWDPWFDDWYYYNYYHYNPPHYYYWTYEDGHGSWNSKPKKKRNFSRGDSDPGEERYRTKQKQPSSHKKMVERVEQFVPRDKGTDDRIISVSQRPVVKNDDVSKKSKPTEKVKTSGPRVLRHHSKLDRDNEPKSVTPANKPPKTKKSPDVSRSKRVSKPKTSDVPREKSRVSEPSKRPPSRDNVKKSSPPKSSKPARVKSAPSRSKPSYKSAPSKSSSSGSKSSSKKSSKSSGSKNGGKKRK